MVRAEKKHSEPEAVVDILLDLQKFCRGVLLLDFPLPAQVSKQASEEIDFPGPRFLGEKLCFGIKLDDIKPRLEPLGRFKVLYIKLMLRNTKGIKRKGE